MTVKIYTHSNQEFPLGAREVSMRSILFAYVSNASERRNNAGNLSAKSI